MSTGSAKTWVATRPALWRLVFATMAAPAEIIRRHAADLPAPMALMVSGSAFACFFAQTAIDLQRGQAWDQGALAGAAVLAASGLLLGTLGVALLALLTWVLTRPLGADTPFGYTLRAFGLAFAPTLVYGLCGLAAQLGLGWPAALAFGVTGYLWALAPLNAAITDLVGERRAAGLLLTTLIGAVLLLAWAAIGLGQTP